MIAKYSAFPYRAVEQYQPVKEGRLDQFVSQFLFFKRWKPYYYRLYPTHLVAVRLEEGGQAGRNVKNEWDLFGSMVRVLTTLPNTPEPSFGVLIELSFGESVTLRMESEAEAKDWAVRIQQIVEDYGSGFELGIWDRTPVTQTRPPKPTTSSTQILSTKPRAPVEQTKKHSKDESSSSGVDGVGTPSKIAREQTTLDRDIETEKEESPKHGEDLEAEVPDTLQRVSTEVAPVFPTPQATTTTKPATATATTTTTKTAATAAITIIEKKMMKKLN
eukprot:c20393_g1_i3.p1 GENE.c20393_g1_i3~~c20393_g1_i3.p1  ORF type:complete len:274 (+),score=66.90 c20393_g1_i3:106-927(+)